MTPSNHVATRRQFLPPSYHHLYDDDDNQDERDATCLKLKVCLFYSFFILCPTNDYLHRLCTYNLFPQRWCWHEWKAKDRVRGWKRQGRVREATVCLFYYIFIPPLFIKRHSQLELPQHHANTPHPTPSPSPSPTATNCVTTRWPPTIKHIQDSRHISRYVFIWSLSSLYWMVIYS